MSKHLGDFDTSTVVYGKFTTFRPSTGAAYTLGGTPALSVYKDASTTQSTTGVTLTADFDSVTGLNHFAIDTSADGTFYSSGSFFDIVITTGTVDSVSVVGAVVGSFTLRKNSSLKPATAGRTLAVDASNRASADALAINSVATSSVTTVNANIGTTNAINFFGSGATGYVKADVRTVTGNAQSAGDIVNNQDIIYTDLSAVKAKTDSLTFTVAGEVNANTRYISNSAVSTTTAQIGTNVVQVSGDSTAADNAESFFDGSGYGVHVARTTVASVTSQTILMLNAGTISLAVANAYKGCMVIIRDHTDTKNVMFAVCTAYDESTGQLTIDSTSGATFTIAASNIVEFVTPTFSQDDRTTLAAAGTASLTVNAAYVDAAHTWTFPSAVQTTATRIINELIGFNGLASMDFTNVIPPEVAISSVDSATFANISGTEPTVGTTSVSTNLKKVLIPINATAATANTYTLSVTVTTTDSQQFTRKGQFTVA